MGSHIGQLFRLIVTFGNNSVFGYNDSTHGYFSFFEGDFGLFNGLVHEVLVGENFQ
jgi:hypothetical protein